MERIGGLLVVVLRVVVDFPWIVSRVSLNGLVSVSRKVDSIDVVLMGALARNMDRGGGLKLKLDTDYILKRVSLARLLPANSQSRINPVRTSQQI